MKKFFYELKIVRTRKIHKCIVCARDIPKASRTLVESGFNHDEGFFANYFHIDKETACHLDYLDACQPSDSTIPKKLEDVSFFGQLLFERWRKE